MDLVLAGLQFEICLAFLDDVIIFGSTFEENCERLQKVFDRIAESKIKLRADKELFRGRIENNVRLMSKSVVYWRTRLTTSCSLQVALYVQRP